MTAIWQEPWVTVGRLLARRVQRRELRRRPAFRLHAKQRRGMERLGDLAGEGQRFVERDRSARKTIGQRRALDELHHERTYAVSRSRAFLEAVELRDVRVVQRSEDLGLTLKPRHAFGIVSEVARENLDRNGAAQLRVAGAIHLAHPTGPKLELYLVHAETRARSKGHFAGLSHAVQGGPATLDHRHGDRATQRRGDGSLDRWTTIGLSASSNHLCTLPET